MTDDFSGVMETAYHPHVSPVQSDTYLEEVAEKNVADSDLSEIYHEHSKLDERTFQKMSRTIDELDSPAMQYFQSAISPDYREAQRVDLPAPDDVEADLTTVLTERRSRREFAADGLTLQQLSTTLRYACGPSKTEAREILNMSVTNTSRTYPSAGALYPIETYLLVFDSPDLERGIYYYRPDDHCLRILSAGEDLPIADAFGVPVTEWNTSVVAVLTGAFVRSKAKYGPRAYRYCLQESGHIAQNLQLVGEALDVASVPLAGFLDERINDLIDVDGVNEAVLYAIAMGNAPTDDT